MEVTLKEAYEGIKEVLEDFKITRCYELDDSWIFDFTGKDYLRIGPPFQITKDGEYVDFWYDGYKKYGSFYGKWLMENAKEIPIEKLEALIN